MKGSERKDKEGSIAIQKKELRKGEGERIVHLTFDDQTSYSQFHPGTSSIVLQHQH